MKKMMTTMVAGAVWLSAWSGSALAVSFQDAEGHWASGAIRTAVEQGMVDGYPDGSFRPDQSISRAEFVKMLSSALKLQPTAPAAGQDWYQPYVNGAVTAGIHRYEDFNQDINGAITRQEMMRLVVRATDKRLQSAEVQMDDKSFTYNATKAGLIQGLSGGELGLTEATTRAQAVTVVQRVLTASGGGQLEVDKAALQRAEVALNGTNFETTVGRKPAFKLPVEYELTSGINMRIDEIYVVDTSDETSPYRWIVEGARRQDKKSIENNYMFVYKVHYDLGSESSRESSLIVGDYFKMTGWRAVSLQNPYKYDVIRRNDTGTYSSFFAFAMDKVEDEPLNSITPYFLVDRKRAVLFLRN